MNSPEIDDTNLGLLKVSARARMASQIAQIWSAGRMDVNPEEVAVATLLGGTGDLLLWVYAMEIPEKADQLLGSGIARRSAEAQKLACGFAFKDLTLQCAERWKLPALVIQLLRGSESVRAQMTRTCSNAARHLLDESETSTLALATDLVEASALIPNVSLEWLIDGLVRLPDERRPALLEKAQALLAAQPRPVSGN